MRILNLKIQFIVYIFFIILYSCDTKEDVINETDILEIKSIKGKTNIETFNLLENELLKDDISQSKKALIFFRKGKLLSIQQKDKDAVNSFKQSLVIFKAIKSKRYITETYWQLGSSYAFLDEKVMATEYLLKALELNKTLKDSKLEANIYGSLAHVHYLYNDFEKSVGYTLKAIDIQYKNKDSLGLSATYNNLAVIYKNILQYDDAINYNKKSLALNKLLHKKAAVAKSYNNLGQVYEQTGNYNEAILYYKKAMALNDSLKNANTSAILNIANLYLRQKNTDKAKSFFLKAAIIASGDNLISVQEKIYNKLLEISLKNKNIEKSLVFQRKRDSLANIKNNIENNEKLKSLEIQYQLSNKKNELQKERQQNKVAKIILVIIIIFIIITTLLLVLFLKNKKLKNEKEKIKLEQQVLRSQMNPHFIFNALSAIQNSLLDNQPMKSAMYLSRFAKLIRQNFDFVNEKSILLKDELEALKNYMDTQRLRFNDKFDYEINIVDTVDVDIDEIPPLLLQPFVENAIEHGFKNKQEKGKITITISKNNKSICYEIVDNGKGFDMSEKDKKIHAIDIFKKRLELLENYNKKSFSITSSDKGTHIKFCLKQ